MGVSRPRGPATLKGGSGPPVATRQRVGDGDGSRAGRQSRSRRGAGARDSHLHPWRLARRPRRHGNRGPFLPPSFPPTSCPFPALAPHTRRDGAGWVLLGNRRRASASAARLSFHPSPTSARRRRRWGRVGSAAAKPRGGQGSPALSPSRPALPAKMTSSFLLAFEYCVLGPGRRDE